MNAEFGKETLMEHSREKVFGIGLSRTGTTSLTKALALLGYRACHYPLFLLYMAKSELRIDVDRALPWEGLTDTVIAHFFQELDARYPQARFILTTRERRSWLESCKEMLSRRPPEKMDPRDLALRVALFGTVEFDEAKYTAAYDRHLDVVSEHFKNRPQDLLVLDIIGGQGWPELCGFLGRPVPSRTFPWLYKLKSHEPAQTSPSGSADEVRFSRQERASQHSENVLGTSPSLAIVVITKDKEKSINAVIQNAFQIAGEVVVVDTGSKDKTPTRIVEAGARLISLPMELFDYSTPRNAGMEAARADFVLFLDSDERIDADCAAVIYATLNRGAHDIFRVLQQSFDVQGRPISGFYPDRLMKKGAYVSEGLVYESFSPRGPYGNLEVMISQTDSLEEIRTKAMNRRSLVEREFRNLEARRPPATVQEAVDAIARLQCLYFAGLHAPSVIDLVRRNYLLALDRDPTHEWLAIETSVFLRTIHRFKDAEDVLARVTNVESTSHRFAYELSLVMTNIGNLAMAKRAIRRAISQCYCSAYLKFEARLCLEMNDTLGALDSLDQARQLLPQDPEIPLILSTVLGFAKSADSGGLTLAMEERE